MWEKREANEGMTDVTVYNCCNKMITGRSISCRDSTTLNVTVSNSKVSHLLLRNFFKKSRFRSRFLANCCHLRGLLAGVLYTGLLTPSPCWLFTNYNMPSCDLFLTYYILILFKKHSGDAVMVKLHRCRTRPVERCSERLIYVCLWQLWRCSLYIGCCK